MLPFSGYLWFDIRFRRHCSGNYNVKLSQRNISDTGLFDSSMNIVLSLESGHDIRIMKMAILDKFDYIEI